MTATIIEQVLAAPRAEKEAIFQALQRELQTTPSWKPGDPQVVDGVYTEAYAEELRRRLANLDDSFTLEEIFSRIEASQA